MAGDRDYLEVTVERFRVRGSTRQVAEILAQLQQVPDRLEAYPEPEPSDDGLFPPPAPTPQQIAPQQDWQQWEEPTAVEAEVVPTALPKKVHSKPKPWPHLAQISRHKAIALLSELVMAIAIMTVGIAVYRIVFAPQPQPAPTAPAPKPAPAKK